MPDPLGTAPLTERTRGLETREHNHTAPARSESAKSGVIYAFLGNTLFATSQWLISMFIVKAGGAALLGTYTISMAIITPITLVTQMNLRGILVTDAERRVPFSDFLGLRLVATAIGGCVALLVLLFLPGNNLAAWLLGCAVVFYRAVENVPDLVHGLFQRAGQMKLVAVSLLLRTFSILGIFAIGCLLFKAVTGSFVAIALASIAVTLFLDARLARQFGWSRPRLDRKLAALAKTALPMAIVALLYSLHVAMPRFFLEQTSNRQTLGQFAGLLNLVSVAAMGAQAVSVTLSPRMAEAYHEGKFHQFIKLIGVLLVTDLSIALFLFGVTSTYGQSLLLLAYNHEIGAAASALPHFVLATGLMLIELHIGVIQTAMRRFRQQVIVQFVKLASAACLYWLAHFSNDLIAAVGVLSLSYLIAIFVGIVFVVSGLNRRPVPSAPLRG